MINFDNIAKGDIKNIIQISRKFQIIPTEY